MSNNRIVLVANSIGTAGSSADTYASALTAGQLNLLEEDTAGAISDLDNGRTVAGYPKVHVLVGKGSTYAPDAVVIKGSGIVTWKSAAYSAGYKQNTVCGYDGVNTEQLPVTVYNDHEYSIRVTTTDVENTYKRNAGPGKTYDIRSGYNANSATHGRYSVVKALVEAMNADDDPLVVAKIRQSETMTALAANCVVVNGSTTVTTTDTTGIAAGVFVGLGGDFYKVSSVVLNTSFVIDRAYAGASATIKYDQAPPANWDVVNGSTTVTTTDTTGPDIAAGDYVSAGNAVYVVQSVVAATSFVIDRPYEGATATLTAGVVPGTTAAVLGACNYVAGATVDDNTYFGIHCYSVDADVPFKISLEDGFDGDELITDKNAVSFSTGTYAQVAADEESSDQIFGEMNSMLKRTERVRNATAGNTYDKWIVQFTNPQLSPMGGTYEFPTELVIWLLAGATNTMLYDYLNDWLLTSKGSGGFSNV